MGLYPQTLALSIPGVGVSQVRPTCNLTRWSLTLSSKVNLHHAIIFRALCGANLVTSPSKFEGDETLVQGSLAYKTPPPEDPTEALCLGTYNGRSGVGISYERGTPVLHRAERRNFLECFNGPSRDFTPALSGDTTPCRMTEVTLSSHSGHPD